MTGVEDEILLKLKGTFSHAQNHAYLSHHDEGTQASSLLWHVRFGIFDTIIMTTFVF
jgi:hypothetical protein